MIIRQAVRSDAFPVAELAGQLGYPSSPAEVEERLTALLEHPDHGAYVAVTPEQRIVGWVHIFGAPRLMVEPFAELGGLIVDESCRSSGIGRRLVEAAEAWAQDHGYREMRVRSNMLRVGAASFYRNLGYQCSKTQNVFVKNLDTDP